MENNIPRNKLQGKIAIVTGGTSGIGEATARLFAAHGARAVVIAGTNSEKGLSVAESIGSQRCSFVHCDVTDEEQVKSMIEWTATTYGGVDIMFSNASIIHPSVHSVLDFDVSEFDSVMRVNARGAALCVKHAARKMIELGSRGSIICTASLAASMGAVSRTDYVMSKHAVLGLVRSACMQLGVHGIRVNSVSPAAVLTPLTKGIGFATDADVEEQYGFLTSLKGITLTTEHVAEAVVFLASDDSAFVTGHDLMVDGGIVSICLPLANK